MNTNAQAQEVSVPQALVGPGPHVEDEPCYVCDHGPHKGYDPESNPRGHNYWPKSAAAAEFAAEDAKNQSSYSPEAAYVAQHRPY